MLAVTQIHQSVLAPVSAYVDTRSLPLRSLVYVVFDAHLLSQKVSNLDRLSTIVDNDVDREMGVYSLDLVSEALCDTGDHVLNQRLDSSNASDVLSVSVPHCELDDGVSSFGFCG